MRAFHVVYATAAGITREHYLVAETREQAAGILRAAKPGIEVRRVAEVRAIEMEVERWVDGADYYPRVCVWRAGDDLLTGVVADVPERAACGEENGGTIFEETGGMMFSQGEEIALEESEEEDAKRLLNDLEGLLLRAGAEGILS